MGILRSFVLLFISVAAFGAGPYQYVRIPAAKVDKALFEKKGFIRDHKTHSEFVFGYLPERALTRDVVSTYRVLNLNEALLRTIDFDGATLKERGHAVFPDEAAEPYHTYETLTQELKQLVAAHPTIATLESAGKSVQGRELWLVRLMNGKVARESRPKLLYISSMHGDEVTGKEMMVYLLRRILQNYGKDSRITALLDNAELFIMPSMNPDGTELKQRWNANNVDLNRNFPQLDEEAFSIKEREPETLALMALHQKHHFVVGMNFHGGEICVNIPWDSHANVKVEELFGDNELMWALSNAYVATNKPMYENHGGNFVHGVTYGFEWFQILGGMQDWAVFNRQTTHATLEISVAKWPGAAQLPQFWRDNQESLLAYLEGAMTGFHFKVVDQAGVPVPASVKMETATRTLEYPNGLVHRPAVARQQRVEISSPGFQSLTLDRMPRAYDGQLDRIVLQRRNADAP